MTNFEAINIIDPYMSTIGAELPTEEETTAAWQHIIDNGLCWRLEGRYGREARARIDAGLNTGAPAYPEV